MDDKNPLPVYSLMTYLSVVGISCFGGLVRHLNTTNKFNLLALLVDLCTASFTGLVTFWLCEWGKVGGLMSAILIAASGVMGNKAWKELEHLWRIKVYRVAGVPMPGTPPTPHLPQPSEENSKGEVK
ncbi:holin [Achromobacter phage Motura]|uniref:Holin n=1 Tax=Achromobacter phage Motura TaxID=2591403 RepID=A0A514CTC8_9CAUD|nr:holin [Achromobacter phage Motura]QDH83725.1 holin [Achromobacter phage Motura]